jgi:hypothetical protein
MVFTDETKDDMMDKKRGIKEMSKRDMKVDKKKGLPADTIGKIMKKASKKK